MKIQNLGLYIPLYLGCPIRRQSHDTLWANYILPWHFLLGNRIVFFPMVDSMGWDVWELYGHMEGSPSEISSDGE